MNDIFTVDENIKTASDKAIELCRKQFYDIDKTTEINQKRVLQAFVNNRVSEAHFAPSTGYGYDDRGRDTLDKIFAEAFFSEDALVRHSFYSGTHTLATALYGVLRPKDTMLCVTGTPYDTLLEVIDDKGQGKGSLVDFGIHYKQIDLLEDGTLDYDTIKNTVDNSIKMVYIQRSKGYTLRDSLSVSDIEKVVKIVKSKSKETIVMVDNCYGEFVETIEPTSVGADLMAGSLIKNPGGGIAPSGGYIAGRKDLVELCSYRLTTPSTGREIGATLGHNRELYLGFFNAPHVTGEALKTAVFTAALFSSLGFEVSPKYGDKRADIIQTVMLGGKEPLIAFCKGIQSASPVDSFVTPEPSPMPGYDSKVIMAAGAFTLGSSIELSADAPLREPYAVYLQGGLNFHSAKVAVEKAAQKVLEVK